MEVLQKRCQLLEYWLRWLDKHSGEYVNGPTPCADISKYVDRALHGKPPPRRR